MNEIKGLSGDPAEAYQQGRRDGAADALHAVELAATTNDAMVPCPFRNDTVGCPLSSELWLCGYNPCLIQRAQHP